MDHSSHSMGSSMGSGAVERACKISMLWNWNVIDACFISKQWHITSKGMFAGTCIGVILLVMAVELLRRVGKEYDAYLYRQFARQAAATSQASSTDKTALEGGRVATRRKFRATVVQQLVRAVIHACAFGAAYIVMLLAMYYNGYLIICIFLGAGLGKFACDWFMVEVEDGRPCARGKGGCEEVTICCA